MVLLFSLDAAPGGRAKRGRPAPLRSRPMREAVALLTPLSALPSGRAGDQVLDVAPAVGRHRRRHEYRMQRARVVVVDVRLEEFPLLRIGPVDPGAIRRDRVVAPRDVGLVDTVLGLAGTDARSGDAVIVPLDMRAIDLIARWRGLRRRLRERRYAGEE